MKQLVTLFYEQYLIDFTNTRTLRGYKRREGRGKRYLYLAKNTKLQ